MKSPKFEFLKQVLPSSAAALALLAILGITTPARATSFQLCPNAASQNGSGSDTFTPTVGGPLDCGTLSAVTMSISKETDYARLLWDPSVAGYPAGLTLGNLAGLTAAVLENAGQPGDQPFYMLAFTDASDSLGQANVSDQILLIEFQSTTVSGGSMDVDPNATLFNLFDNTSGQYLEGGQHV